MATLKYASFSSRFLALFVDWVILALVDVAIQNSALSFIISTAYFIFFTGYSGATIGKMLLKIKVVSESGKKIDYVTALIRELTTYLSALVFFIGYLNVLWDKKNQAWHDKIAHTLVVKT